MHHPRMKLAFIGLTVVLGVVACGGLAQDINKGASTTEREVNEKTGHDRTIRDGGPGAAPDAADSGSISM